MKEPKPIEKYFPLLAEDETVQKAITEEFADCSGIIIEELRSGNPRDEVYNLIIDLIANNPETVETECRLGAYDAPFPISIVRFGPVFWIEAQEFDDIRYFGSFEDADTYSCCYADFPSVEFDTDGNIIEEEDDENEDVEDK